MQRNRTYSRDSGRPIISAASTPASHDSRQLADATLSVAVTKPSALSFLEPPPLSLLPLAPPGESELYAFDSYASDADRFRRKVQELEEKRQAALREVDDARVKSLRSPSTLAVPASEVDPSSPAKSSFSKESDYTLESRTTDATSFFSASYRPSINSDHSAGFDKTPQTPNVPATVALPSLSQRRGTLAFLRRPSLANTWGRRKQHESPVLVAAAVPAAPPSPLVIKPIEATVRDKKKEEMTKLLDDPDKLADAMTRSTRLRDQLVEADTILNELGWQWGAQANEIWGEGCGHRYLADATVSYAAAESTDARRESGTSSTSDVDMTDAGDMNLPSTSISNHSTDEAAEFVHRGKRYRRHSLGAKVVNKRPRSSSTVTLDSKGLLPTGAAPLLHWRGFNKAYQQGSLDMDEVHYQPRGAPEFSTCPDATPLAVGEYNPPAPEWEARRLRAYWRMQVDRISVDRIGRITSRLEICRAYLGVGEANLRFFEADGTVTTVKEDRLLRAPPSKQSGLCAHALLNRNNGLVILDTSLDWRFQTLGLVGTRFYTGMPVLASSGLPVAVVSFSCQRAWRIFKPDERAKVREVARMIGNELEAHLREIWEAKITLMTQSYADIKTCLEDSKWRSGLKLKTSRTHMGSEYGRAAEMQHNESSGSCRPKITVVGPPSPAPYVKHVPRGLGNNVSHNPIDLEALSKIGVMLSLEDTDRYRTACEHMAASLNIETVYVIAVNLLEQSISPSTVEDNTKVPFVAPLSPALLSPSKNIPTLLVPSSSMLPATSKDARKDACILLACHGLPSPCPIFESKLHSRVFSSGHDPFLVFQNDGKRGVVDPEVDKDLLLPRRCSEEKRKETFYSGIMVQVMTDLEWKRKKQKEDHDNTGAPSYEPPTAAESTTSPPAKTGFVLAALSRRPDRAPS
ncbi:hypothetical protein CBOM_06908 [Ceraceosorus bombacis]|uniref:GAF domain-containing protein n=1 Tax=Ceraceosorus bombacis TaxID=401625 RepID=A0A0P1BRT5_9BASI|nr:hypothetical protein CBOM_06908 [Ceraceosorus bombacis]